MLIVTTINPSSRISYQLACYRKWKSLGCNFRTFNVASEVSELIDFGVHPSDIYIIDDSQSSKLLHGSYSPRIKPVLNIVCSTFNPGEIIVVNSDVYPRLRKLPCGFFNRYSYSAFTRREVHSIFPFDAKKSLYYRSGIDVFYLNKHTLIELLNAFENDTLSDRMAFGVPGWDFFILALLITSPFAGLVADGSVFLHEIHKPTYTDASEFQNYIPRIALLGMVSSLFYKISAAEFSQRISDECESNAQFSQILDLVYGDPWSMLSRY